MNEVAVSTMAMDNDAFKHELFRVNTADYIHVDIGDGDFVETETFWTDTVADINDTVDIPLDVHLMTASPGGHITDFINAGADVINVHIEAVDDAATTIDTIHDNDAEASIAVNPDTPIDDVTPFLDSVDRVLVMSVHPGTGGQDFIPDTVDKITTLRGLDDVTIAVDGGIDDETGKQCSNAGADVLVSGTYIHDHDNPKIAIDILRNL